MSDKIKCPSCGKEIKATAKFCGFCATKIEAEPVEKTIEKSVESTGESSSAYVNPLEGMIPTGGTRGGTKSSDFPEPTNKPYDENEKTDIVPHEKICTVCGKKMAARAKFCGACGGTLVEDTSVADTPQEPLKPVIEADPPKAYESPIVERKTGKKCVSCGAEMRASAKFCGICGGELVDISDTTSGASIKEIGSTEKIHPDFKPAGDL